MTYVAPRIGYDVSFKFLPLLRGDFNGCLGACKNGDDSAVLGTWGFGRRNVHGQLVARWVLQHGLSIFI